VAQVATSDPWTSISKHVPDCEWQRKGSVSWEEVNMQIADVSRVTRDDESICQSTQQTIVIKEASGKVKERVKPLGEMRVTARRVLFADLILKY